MTKRHAAGGFAFGIWMVGFFFATGAFAADGMAELKARAREAGTVRVLVQLALPERAASAPAEGDATRRRRIAAARLRVTAALGQRGARLVRSFDTVPWVALEADEATLARLAASADVLQVRRDRLEKALLFESAEIVQALDLHAAGVTGAGWTVAVLDTGIDSDHYFFGGRVVAEACFSADGSCPNGATEMMGAGAGAPCAYSPSACVHGTHVAGIVAGSGTNAFGVAREAGLISVQIFTEVTGEECDDGTEDPCARTYISDTIKALEYIYSLRFEYRIASVNMSIGGETYGSEAACDAADPRADIFALLRAAGIVSVAAAGNEGEAGILSAPACVSSVVSVSATNDSDAIASFANTATFLDLLAPGAGVTSSLPGGESGTFSGTSQATPHVAGAFALIYDELGEADPESALAALVASGLPVADSATGRSYPRIRIVDALRLLLPTGIPTGLQISPDGKRTLLSKDLGGERWAIVANADDGTVTGNVFLADGSDPAFVWCSRVGDDGATDPYARMITFSCHGANACGEGSCDAAEWNPIAEVELPGSFFLPRLAPAAPNFGGEVGEAPPDAASGLRVSPDGRRTLISKDVEGKRWAISLNDDGSVTGNVYDPAGGAPQFVWCSGEGNDGNPDSQDRIYRFACHGADPCELAPCEQDAWTSLGSVEISGWFFLP
ncbi:MAG: S8 family serine peptidase [Deltaproteobacteria bacterium]